MLVEYKHKKPLYAKMATFLCLSLYLSLCDQYYCTNLPFSSSKLIATAPNDPLNHSTYILPLFLSSFLVTTTITP